MSLAAKIIGTVGSIFGLRKNGNGIALGVGSLAAANTGINNTAIGYKALAVNTSGANNTAIGLNALLTNTSGGSNTGMGYGALRTNSTVSNNTGIGMSSRGVGNGRTDENGVLVIGEGYKLITFDAVADPSTPAAFQERILGKRESYNHQNNFEKNNSSRIYTHNKEQIIAALGGIIKESTNKILARK